MLQNNKIKAEAVYKEENFKRLSNFLKSKQDGTFYTGHASVLVKIGEKKYLIDPVNTKPLFLESWLFFPDLVIDRALLDSVDGVFISHCHEDHYDPALLRSLKKSIPIYITKGRIGFEEILNDTSLNVKPISPWELTEIDPDVKVLCLPSDHNDFDSSFVIKGKSFSAFQGNDNFLDEASILKAKKIVGKVDHSYIPFAYVWWYPFCLTSLSVEQRRSEAKRLSSLNMKIGALIAETFESDLVVPSAANLVFYESADSILNREIASPYDFVKYAKANHPAIAESSKALFAGDYALKTKEGIEIQSQNMTQEEYFSRLNQFLIYVNEQRPPANTRSNINSKDLAVLQSKLSKVDFEKFDLDLYFRRIDLPDWALKVSMMDYSCDIVNNPEKEKGTITFDIQQHAFEWWLEGKVNLETILNSQRFLVHRNPEEFNPKVWNVLRSYF